MTSAYCREIESKPSQAPPDNARDPMTLLLKMVMRWGPDQRQSGPDPRDAFLLDIKAVVRIPSGRLFGA